MSGSDVKFVLATLLFIGKSARWIADACRAGRIAGAVRIGQAWFVDVAAFTAANTAVQPVETVDAAIEADIRRRFVCTR